MTALDGAVDDPLDPLCFGLRGQLGRFGYQWLCASAVYPRLRFAFSCYLGSELAKAYRRSPVSEPEMLALFRLPWFRTGYMPHNLRIRLLADLESEAREAAVSAIAQAFYGATIDKNGEQSWAPLPLGPTTNHVKAALRTYVDSSTVDAVEHDIIFARTLAGSETTDAAIARDWDRISWLGWSATRLLVPANLVFFAAILLLAVAWQTTDVWLRPHFRTTSPAITKAEQTQTNFADTADNAAPNNPTREASQGGVGSGSRASTDVADIADNAVPAENARKNPTREASQEGGKSGSPVSTNVADIADNAVPAENAGKNPTREASQEGGKSGSPASSRLNIPESKLASMLVQEQRRFFEANNGAETATVTSGYEDGRAYFYYYADDAGGPTRFKKDVASGNIIPENN